MNEYFDFIVLTKPSEKKIRPEREKDKYCFLSSVCPEFNACSLVSGKCFSNRAFAALRVRGLWKECRFHDG